MVATEKPLRERKKQATRAALRRSAVALVAERGLADVTVEDIAAAADVSTRTFFNYFPTKEDAVVGWDPALMAEIVDRLQCRPSREDAPAALRAMLLDVFGEFQVDRRELLERLRVTRSDPHLLAHFASRWGDTERQLVAVLAARRETEDHYAWLVVATTMSAARVALMSWCDQEGRVSLVEELDAHLDILGAGLAEPERGEI